MKVRQTVGIRATPRAQFLAGTTFLEVAQAAVHKFHLCERKYNARKCVYDADVGVLIYGESVDVVHLHAHSIYYK